MAAQDIPWKRRLHVGPDPGPAARDVEQMRMPFGIHLAQLLAGNVGNPCAQEKIYKKN